MVYYRLMAKRLELKKGFLKLQRLGPIKFGEQSRWSVRAPERYGMWAFPYPHFEMFYAYHKFTDLAPKELRERHPKNPKWYAKSWDDDEPVDAIEFAKIESYGELELLPCYRNENGELKEAMLTGEYYEAREKWVTEVGKKILPMREFWYSGELYTHFKHDGSVGDYTMNSDGEGNEWSLMDTTKLARLMSKPGGVVYSDGAHTGDGKPRTFSYAQDHLEVFIPRGRGVIRDRL